MAYKLKLSSCETEITVKLYRNVRNLQELRKNLLEGSLKCCMIKAKLIPDPFIIAQAANKAFSVEQTTTKSIYTEILFNLSLSKNITQSLTLFGIDETDTDLLVVSFGDESVFDVIDGDESDIKELDLIRDLKRIKKIYKLNDHEISENLIDAVSNKIAIKDFS